MNFYKATIPFFVFVTGACVLIIELLAIRMLAPYFGNTIFAVSSVISVVLAALSLGYYAGGKMADRYPKEELFYGIIAASGCCIIVLRLLGIIFLYQWGYKLSLTTGPFIAALFLFFPQSFLLGTLSPFAIKLQAMRQEAVGLGSVSGGIFFWSTLGSIFGSLSAGFFLIPTFGINSIILTIGVILIILGVFSMLKVSVWLKLSSAATVLLVFVIFMHFLAVSLEAENKKAGWYSRDGVYQKITIHDGQYKGKPTRFLSQDRDSSAAQFIGSSELVYDYTKYYALYKIFNPGVRQALMIGGGGYSVPMALLSESPEITVEVAEIEPMLFNLIKAHFNIPDDKRLHNVVEDGRRFLAQTQKKYDLIFSDAYASLYSAPSHLTTQEFFTLAKSRLNDHGVFIANVIGSLAQKPESLALSEIKTFKQVFNNSYFFAVVSPESPTLQNLIFIGYNSADIVDLQGTGVLSNGNVTIREASQKQINVDLFDLSGYPVLTDDFSPVEYLIAKEL